MDKVKTLLKNDYECFAVVEINEDEEIIIEKFRLKETAKHFLEKQKSMFPWICFKIKWIEEK